jgi:hypothetical protein
MQLHHQQDEGNSKIFFDIHADEDQSDGRITQ